MSLLRQALIERKLTVGSWIQTGSPVVAEILSSMSFDWIAVDCEHSAVHIAEFTEVARGINGRNTVTLARVRENDTLAIRQVLDMGAQGVIVPLINNARQARDAVSAAKYPPEGVRGFCFARMNSWGAEFDRYAQTANEDIAVVAMIESKEAVENIDEILDVPGIDAIFIGPYDMSGSYGLTGQTEHPVIKQACQKVSAACQRHKKSAGMHIVLPTDENVQQAIQDGFTFLALGTDIMFIRYSAQKALDLLGDSHKGDVLRD